MNIDARWEGRASGLVTAITIRKSAIEPLEENHLRPSITQSVAVAHGARAQLRGVRAGRVGLGHAEGAAQVAGQQRMQPAVLLLGRAGQREDLGVAGVRRGVAERQRRDRRGAEDLVHQAEADLAHALPAELGRQVGGPQPARLDLLLQRRHRARSARRARARARSPPAARSRGGRSRPSSRAAPGSRGRWRSPSSWRRVLSVGRQDGVLPRLCARRLRGSGRARAPQLSAGCRRRASGIEERAAASIAAPAER